MTFSDFAKRAFAINAAAGPMAREAARQQAAIDERAIRLKHRFLLTDDVAALVAWFTLSGWAQRWPVQGYDLGEDAALFVAEWLCTRSVGGVDAMHEALGEWQRGEFMRELRLRIAGAA